MTKFISKTYSDVINAKSKPSSRHAETLRAVVSASNKKGFTLIELLVVVLIIGILASVAVPQYQKAVWKTRAAELRSVTRTLATAQESYLLANGTYPESFESMDLDFNLPDKGLRSRCGLTTPDSRGNKQYELVLNNNFTQPHYLSSSMFLAGPYKCAGFVFVHPQTNASGVKAGKMYCWEYQHGLNEEGVFCEKVMQGRFITAVPLGPFRIYELP